MVRLSRREARQFSFISLVSWKMELNLIVQEIGMNHFSLLLELVRSSAPGKMVSSK